MSPEGDIYPLGFVALILAEIGKCHHANRPGARQPWFPTSACFSRYARHYSQPFAFCTFLLLTLISFACALPALCWARDQGFHVPCLSPIHPLRFHLSTGGSSVPHHLVPQ